MAAICSPAGRRWSSSTPWSREDSSVVRAAGARLADGLAGAGETPSDRHRRARGGVDAGHRDVRGGGDARRRPRAGASPARQPDRGTRGAAVAHPSPSRTPRSTRDLGFSIRWSGGRHPGDRAVVGELASPCVNPAFAPRAAEGPARARARPQMITTFTVSIHPAAAEGRQPAPPLAAVSIRPRAGRMPMPSAGWSPPTSAPGCCCPARRRTSCATCPDSSSRPAAAR